MLERLRRHPRRVMAIGDGLVLLSVLLIVAAELAGDFEAAVLGVRISVRSTWRIAVWACVIAAVRHYLVRSPTIVDRIVTERDRAGEIRPAGWALIAGVFLIYAAATVLVLLPQVRQLSSVPDQGDPLFSIWRLAWVAHQVPIAPLQLYDANIFHPHALTLAYSDAMIVPALAAAPLLWAGVHQVTVYNVVLLAAIALSGVTMFFLVRDLAGSHPAAFVAATIFAFSMFRFSHYSHLELQVAHWMPLALLGFHRVVTRGSWRGGVVMGLAVAAQMLSSLYYGIYFVLFATVLAVTVWAAGALRVRAAVRPLAAGAVLAAAIVIPLTIPYWQNRAHVGERPRGAIEYYSARPAEFLAPHQRSVYAGYGVRAADGERELFPGVMPIALASIGLWPPLSPLRLAYGVSLAFAADAALGFNGEVYHWLYAFVPGLAGLRVPARFGMIVVLALAVLAGYGMARLLRRMPGRAARAGLAAAATIAVAAEARPTLTLEPIWPAPPRVYDALPADRRTVLAELPFPESAGGLWEECRFMYFSTFHWHELVNGNSGFFPPDYHELRKTMQAFPSDPAMWTLRRYGVEHIAIHEAFYRPESYPTVVAALDRRSDVTLVATDSWYGREVRLYRLGPAAARRERIPAAER